MFGHTVGAAIGLGYVDCRDGEPTADYILSGSYELDVAGTRVAATPSLKPFYDPSMARVKA